jgi:hypothetical protein
LLILSILVLFAGPLLYAWLQRGGIVARTLDRVVLAALIGVVFLLLVPESIDQLGWWALLLIFAGYLVPGILERLVKSAAVTFHMASLAAALLGLVLHALLDGAGLAGSEHLVGSSLGLAIVLHRLGVGLIVWLLVQPLYGGKAALAVLMMVAATTVIGYGLSSQVLPLAGAQSFQVVQALIIGAIVHSLLHRGHGEKAHQHS